MSKLVRVAILANLILLLGCANPEPMATPTMSPAVPPSPVVIPPTFTPIPASERLQTVPQVTVTQPTRVPTNTPVPFGDTVIELRYTIPAIGLDRRLQGSVSSHIILVDETITLPVQLNNQGSILLDLQQVLSDLDLPDVPEGCNTCVHVSYQLPFEEVQAEGWLQDPVLLASIENFMTTHLGPHFPPGTVAGLRRSASPFAPAHTVAVTADGRLFTWVANEAQVSEATDVDPAFFLAFATLDGVNLQTQYTVGCAGAALETLFLQAEDSIWKIAIVCPEYALPSSILPLYLQLNEPLTAKLSTITSALPRPPSLFPLDALVDYRRLDGSRLTIHHDGTAVAVDAANQVYTSTIGSTQAISLTTSLVASGALQSGLTTFSGELETGGNGLTPTPNPLRSWLLVRGPQGVLDGEWFNTSDVPVLAELNALLNRMIIQGTDTGDEEDGTETPDASAAETPTPEATPQPSPTP